MRHSARKRSPDRRAAGGGRAPVLQAIKLMGQAKDGGRLFTPASANQMLPLLSQIVRDLIELDDSIRARSSRLDGLIEHRDWSDPDPYDAELLAVRGSLEEDRRQLAAYRSELQALGVELRSAAEGILEFPSWLQNRPVYLCWRPTDAAVSHWREIAEPVGTRHPIGAEVFGAGDLPVRPPHPEGPPQTTEGLRQ